MRFLIALSLGALVLTACGTETAGQPVRAADPGDGPTATAMPTDVPPASGPVRTRGLATVLDDGPGPPQLCLGAVAESYPPQCGGVPLAGWDWGATQGIFERVNGVRWGQFAVTGRFEGETLTVTGQVPGPLYSPLAGTPTPTPSPAVTLPPGELEEIATALAGLPGALHSGRVGDHVLLGVVHDDGSLQAWADAMYGEGVVRVVSQLVPVDSSG